MPLLAYKLISNYLPIFMMIHVEENSRSSSQLWEQEADDDQEKWPSVWIGHSGWREHRFTNKFGTDFAFEDRYVNHQADEQEQA